MEWGAGGVEWDGGIDRGWGNVNGLEQCREPELVGVVEWGGVVDWGEVGWSRVEWGEVVEWD